MLKKKMTYQDYKGNERTEEFFFNLTKAEVMEMELSVEGGLVGFIEKVVEAQDGPKLIHLFKELILKSYGEKSPDGRQFIKNDELRTAFSQTEAYSDLFMELASNTEQAAVFVNGIVPQID